MGRIKFGGIKGFLILKDCKRYANELWACKECKRIFQKGKRFNFVSIIFERCRNLPSLFRDDLIDEGGPDWLEPQMVRDTASFYWDSLSKRSVSSVVRL